VRGNARGRSKDFGVIATEHGWNLYGRRERRVKPRHADLLASDVDTEMLVRLVDRFLMFYIRAADRLQRTAGWIEAMAGGLTTCGTWCAYSLGICADLEAAMAGHVESYSDEWRGVLDDPEKLARFSSFVNAPGCRSHSDLRRNAGSGCPCRWGSPRWWRDDRDLPFDRLLPNRGVAALLPGNVQVAVSAPVTARMYALSNIDPFSHAPSCRGASSVIEGELRWPCPRCTRTPSTCVPACAWTIRTCRSTSTRSPSTPACPGGSAVTLTLDVEVPPLAGFTVGVTAARRADELGALLERRGATVVHGPAIRIVPLPDDAELRAATRR